MPRGFRPQHPAHACRVSVVAVGKLINAAAYRFDPLKDLAPVGMLNTAPMVVVARPGLPVKTWSDFVQLAKAAPGRYIYATSGIGTVLHLAIPHIRDRSVKALGVTGAERLAVLPDVPSFADMPGLKGFAMTSWTGLYAPAATPPAVVARLTEALVAALADPEVVAKLKEQGALPGGGTPDALNRHGQAEFASNAKLVRTIDIKD